MQTFTCPKCGSQQIQGKSLTTSHTYSWYCPSCFHAWEEPIQRVSVVSTKDSEHIRLLRCSECGAHDWTCEKVVSDNQTGTMQLILACKNCHARFSLRLGKFGPELPTLP